jgi:hypothetical protein
MPNRAQYDFAEAHPHPGDDPINRLAHTLEMFDGQPDEEMAILATSDAYPDGGKTGLTWGDLRAILDTFRPS